ncbi:MAG: DUF4390 domain-containing protein [Acidobacteria bacterium]|nr:DUF4390 domain-containing protein [Acidobacteriota bacterium]
MSITAALLSLSLWAAAEPPKPRVTHLLAGVEGSRIEVGFDLRDAFDAAFRERVESGLPTSIIYEMQLVRERRMWFDRKVARSELEVSATYDGVTMEYQVHFRLDGELVESRVVQEPAELERAMTRIRNLTVLKAPADRRERCQVRVRADLGSKTWLSLIPIRITTDWAVADLPATGSANG